MRIDAKRGTGRTTRQLQEAPQGAVFICVGGREGNMYTRGLCEKVGRQDLRIVPPAWLEHRERWIGMRLTGVIVDHAVVLTRNQNLGLAYALACVRVPV
jgi:hypothetical protein